jgi:hypothetical protein
MTRRAFLEERRRTGQVDALFCPLVEHSLKDPVSRMTVEMMGDSERLKCRLEAAHAAGLPESVQRALFDAINLLEEAGDQGVRNRVSSALASPSGQVKKSPGAKCSGAWVTISGVGAVMGRCRRAAGGRRRTLPFPRQGMPTPLFCGLRPPQQPPEPH